jgi:prepilin-type processing-associated H-X9-DG protein
VTGGRRTNAGQSYSATFNATTPKSGFVGSGTTTDISESEVVEPASTIHIMDAMTGGSGSGTFGNPLNLGNSIRGIQQDIRTDMYPDGTASKVAYRHSDGFVILYGDGHSGWKKWGSTTPCMWTIQSDTCP